MGSAADPSGQASAAHVELAARSPSRRLVLALRLANNSLININTGTQLEHTLDNGS